jgi:hypothetical protein
VPGFSGYYLIEADNGVVLSSINFFDTSEHADESTRVACNWVRENKLETALPATPKITSGGRRERDARARSGVNRLKLFLVAEKARSRGPSRRTARIRSSGRARAVRHGWIYARPRRLGAPDWCSGRRRRRFSLV